MYHDWAFPSHERWTSGYQIQIRTQPPRYKKPKTMDALLDDILFHVVANMTPGDLMRFSRTSSTHYAIVQIYKKTHYSVAKHLERFFPGNMYQQFRELQARTGALLFGSVAFDFFTRTINDESALDVMVTLLPYGEVAEWLQVRGYVFQNEGQNSDDDSDEDELEYSDDVASDEEDDEEDDERSLPPEIGIFSNGNLSIHVWIARHTTLERVIGSNLNTEPKLACTMNCITANDAISLYPHSSFHERQALRLRNNDTVASDDFVEKYRQRGWTIVDDVDVVDRNTVESDFYTDDDATGIRYFGDSKCWTIPCVKDDSLTQVALYHHINSWTLEFSSQVAHCRYTVIRSDDLLERYLVAQNEELQDVISDAMYGPR
ncbi:hypothetical protein BDN72DRAFT_865310 [Pluteus cervinus]|uniref:Uncharacterized protein n=1 Tax=Pluteus cervinus TaxID=181527 RepID=A0ACD3A0M5_9AGAR|nr:hypothetical protein BDN72DRAFT_865310 [Pluteus cervinus]